MERTLLFLPPRAQRVLGGVPAEPGRGVLPRTENGERRTENGFLENRLPPMGMNMRPSTLTMGRRPKKRRDPMLDFTVTDAAGRPWTLSDHRDAAAVVTFQRGDF